MAADEQIAIKEVLKFKTPKLIQLMKDRETLWDTECLSFKDMAERMKLWTEIGRQLFSKYDEYDAEMQKTLIAELKIRWHNLRKSYMRHQKDPNKLKPYYIYDKEMSFYMKRLSRQKVKKKYGDFMFMNEEFLEEEEQKEQKSKTSMKSRAHTQVQHKKIKLMPREIDEETTSDEQLQSKDYDEKHLDMVTSLDVKENAAEDGELFYLKIERIEVQEEKQQEEVQRKEFVKGELANCFKTAAKQTSRENPSNEKPVIKATASNSKLPTDIEIDDNGDQAFFNSIKPILCGLRHEQTLEFRIDVMALLRKYASTKKTNDETLYDQYL